MFAVIELTAYLRLAMATLLVVAAAMLVSRRLAVPWRRRWGLSNCSSPVACWQDSHGSVMRPAQWRRFRAGNVLISLAMLAIAASLSLSGSNFVALLGFWTVILGEELWAWRSLLPASARSPLSRDHGYVVPGERAGTMSGTMYPWSWSG